MAASSPPSTGPPVIHSLKREMRNLSEECSLEPVTVSMAYVYFEKLVLQGKLNKQNRKLCAGACVLLAAKISSDLRRGEVKQLIDVSTPPPPRPGCPRGDPEPGLHLLSWAGDRTGPRVTTSRFQCRSWRKGSDSTDGI